MLRVPAHKRVYLCGSSRLPTTSSSLIMTDEVIADEHRRVVLPQGGRMVASFLVVGFVAGTWRFERSKRRSVVVLSPFDPLPANVEDPLKQEASRLLSATGDDTDATGVIVSPES